MRFLVLSRGEVVGASDLPWIDVGMGVVSGPFHPNERYATIQPTIRAHHFADGSLGSHNPVALEQARQRIEELQLRVQTQDGKPLECNTVFLTDFSQELEENSMEVTIYGFEPETLCAFWPTEYATR